VHDPVADPELTAIGILTYLQPISPVLAEIFDLDDITETENPIISDILRYSLSPDRRGSAGTATHEKRQINCRLFHAASWLVMPSHSSQVSR
jgi:hypothetical protein